MINITVNNTPHKIPKKSTLKLMLDELNISSEGIAVAINQEVILTEDWSHTFLAENDTILIIQATQGG